MGDFGTVASLTAVIVATNVPSKGWMETKMGREVKRVPADFDWPIKKTWDGFINPLEHAKDCEACSGSGYSPIARLLIDQWHGYAPFSPADNGSTPLTPDTPAMQAIILRSFKLPPDHCFDAGIHKLATQWLNKLNQQWCHQLNESDVEALLAEDRLWEFQRTGYVPTVQEVNEWSVEHYHDAINRWVCVSARCKRMGVSERCELCDGSGSIWQSKEAKAAYEEWEREDPPAGDAYQIWETVSAGSPISPPFLKPEDLADWMVNNDHSITADTTAEEWVRFILRGGSAPSMAGSSGHIMSGVKFIAQVTPAS